MSATTDAGEAPSLQATAAAPSGSPPAAYPSASAPAAAHRNGAQQPGARPHPETIGAEIVFRKDLDKKGVQARVPVEPSVARALDAWLREAERPLGTDVVFPYGDEGMPVRRDRLALAFIDVEREAKLEPLERTLFHAYRRKFASDRAHLPNNVVMKLMGIADMQTFLTCSCKTSTTLLREVLKGAQREWDRHRTSAA
jgi:integrase